MDTLRFEVLEWTVENFCCYDDQIHELFIETPSFVQNKSIWFKLYPKGLLCQSGILSVRIKNFSHKHLFGDISVIASDGALLWLNLLNTNHENDIFEGPKYEDVVRHIQKIEGIHKDVLTVRIRFKSDTDIHHVMRTNVDASDVSFKIDPQFVEKLISSDQSVLPVGSMKCLIENAQMAVNSEMVRSNDGDTIAFSLVRRNAREYLVKSCVTLLSSDGTVLKSLKNKCVIFNSAPWTFLDSLKKEELEGKDVTLVLNFTIISGNIRTRHSRASCLAVEVSPGDENSSVGSPCSSLVTSKKSNVSATALSANLKCLYEHREYSDLTLKCDHVLFKVHKNILCARSPVFKRMLSSNMREAASGIVVIEDVDTSTVRLFLTYLYTGTVDGLEAESALKLFYTADKYQVPSLKRECSDILKNKISFSNVCDVLSLADKHKDDMLTMAAHAFVLKNLPGVLCSEEWESFLKREPALAAQTLTLFAQKKYVISSNANLSNG